MIPSIVARQIRETVLDYLETTFSLADERFEDALFSFLDRDEGLFRGPFVDIRLPFRTAAPGEKIPLEIRPPFDPYKHQLKSFQRLYSKDGHQPQNTLVTTGTGSGKTECFLYPILDHCWRNRDAEGIKAIILYPMNALASDQARRLARVLWEDERLKSTVTAGLYVGGNGQHGASGPDHLVDKRDILRDSPPDILLTNYKMLDFLLMRPEDRKLWRHNGPDTLRYLVLDELHTYDGAQGSDVACLIRRLKRRLGCSPGSVCAVGTSATIGGTMRGETVQALTNFATKVFDEDFFDDSVVTEDRYGPEETLGQVVDLDRFPSREDAALLTPEAHPDAETWLQAQAQLWLGEEGLSPVEISRRLERHEFLRDVLKVLGRGLMSLNDLSKALEPRVPKWEEFDETERRQLLESFIGLVSRAKRESGEPFLTVQVQLWLRELRRLVVKVSGPSDGFTLAWADDGPPIEGEKSHWLPIAHCRECGGVGLAASQREGEQELQPEGAGMAWFRRSRASRYIAYGHGAPDGEFPSYLCRQCLRVLPTEACDDCRDASGGPLRTIPIRISAQTSEPPRSNFLAQCPDCGTDGALSILGSRAPSLLSVGISHLYQSDFNRDKKLLAFTDSVQDASHRAGFFGARTYRFNLRTAMQSVIEEAGEDGVLLSELGDRLWDYWSERMGRERLIPTLLPTDLRELDEYKRFIESGGSGAHRKLESDLRTRLSWETAMEFGLNARVGRTLENTLCATVEEDLETIGEVVEKLALDLEQNMPLETAPKDGWSPRSLFHFISGLIHRTRLRGGIHHPLLRGYIGASGSRYLLSKSKQPLMSPFHPTSVLPRFVSDRAKTAGEKQVFDTFLSRAKPPLTWYQDWASRVLGVGPLDDGLNDLFRTVFKRLEGAGLLERTDLQSHGSAWGLNPDRLHVTSSVAEVVCAECARHVAVSKKEAAHWDGQPCVQYRCTGVFFRVDEPEQSYYARIYQSGRLERIYPHEHTGLLERGEREKLEEEFKEGNKPGATNLFVATPTLEMGIDIGDLSAAVLCSVPPTPANYLQRVGRAGRTTGNAFCLTVANSRPHDLYFHAQPLEMIAGQVLPPGCFLDAPDMLRRQMVAHAMDAWAKQEEELSRIANQSGFLLGDRGKSEFPGRFLDFYEKERQSLTARFIDMFREHLSPANRERLEEYGRGDQIPSDVRGAFGRLETELKELRNVLAKARKRIGEIEKQPQSVKDPEIEIRELEDQRRMLDRLIRELREKYPLNLLTDEGVLPNYAFPEPGVRLESVISHATKDGPKRYEAREYIRPASSAIKELAPFNTFYAEGRKVTIDEIDVGSKTRQLLEMWRFCQECSYMDRELTHEQPEGECPRCGDVNWPDEGQRRTLVHFRRSRSLASGLESSTVDDTEDREEEQYQTLDLIDVGEQHFSGAKLIEDMPFGYELLRDLDLREVNFGLDGAGGEGASRVRGVPVPEQAFIVCSDCGRVKNRRTDEIQHAVTCRKRRSNAEVERKSVSLYRQVRSEAIRILLPVSEVGVDETQASFKAALQLGFRRHFEGDPGHLIVRSTREPGRNGSGDRQFLVVFDGVPGGTGFLADLWQGGHFLAMLQKALDALVACSCQRDPQKDGCYRCLYAYQNQRELKFISSRRAQQLLSEILNQKEKLQDVRTLSDVTLETKIESELEEKFIAALRKRAEKTKGWSWEEKVRGGEISWTLRIGDVAWDLLAQEVLAAGQGVSVACRPDFLIRPVSGDRGIRPVALFCDGFAYHAQPDRERGRIYDDVLKRRSILDSARYAVWSVTWKDVEDFASGNETGSHSSLFADIDMGQLGKIVQKMGVTLNRRTGQKGSMEMLVQYLQSPDLEQWEKLAEAYELGWLTSTNQWMEPDAAELLESRLVSESALFSPGPYETVGNDAAVLSRPHFFKWSAGFASSRRASLEKGKVDRFVLRIFDERGGRAGEGFESDWRGVLHDWNLLQFTNVAVTSSEFIGVTAYDVEVSGAEIAADQDSTAEMVADSAELDEVIELSSEQSRLLIEKAVKAGLPIPVIDFELPSAGIGMGPEPELAWPEARLAVLSERQAADRYAFEAAGWTVLLQPVDQDDLIALLMARRASASAGGEV